MHRAVREAGAPYPPLSVIPSEPSTLIQTFCALSGLINFITCLAFAFFLFIRNKKGKINRLFAFWSFSVAFWSFGYFMWLITPTPSYDHALFWTQFLMAGAIVIPTAYLHFALAYLNLDNKHSHLILFCYLFTGIYLFLDTTPLFINYLEPRYWFRLWPVPGALYHFYQGYFIAVVAYTHVLLFWKARTADSEISRKQLKIVALGTLIAYAGGSTNFFLWYNIPVPPVFNFLVTAYVALIAYAILYYRLWGLDFHIAVTRTTIFVLLCGVIVGFPSALVIWGRPWLVRGFGAHWWMIPLGVYTTLVAGGPFLYFAIQRKAEDRLLREQRRYQQTLLQASRGMTLIKDLKHLLHLIVHILTKTVMITHAAVYLHDKDKELYEKKANRGTGTEEPSVELSETTSLIACLKENRAPLVADEYRLKGPYATGSSQSQILSDLDQLNAAVIIPSFIRERLLGFLILGEKKSKEIYTQDDLHILSTLANQAALAVENCEFIRETEQTRAQLFQAAKMADLGTMASGIGHQINNRLNVIRMGADRSILVDLKKIRQAQLEGKVEDVPTIVQNLEVTLKRIADSAGRGGEIVRRLLDFARVSKGFKPLSIPEVIENCIRLWECKVDLNRINFINRVPSTLPEISGNFSEAEEIVFNLLDNAFDAVILKEEAWEMGKLSKPQSYEKGTVEIGAGEIEREGKNFIEVWVTDTGIGMTPETQKSIFVPFFTTKATAIKGTGLGLFIMKQMVEVHKGEIAVDSEYGKGTTFRIFFSALPGKIHE